MQKSDYYYRRKYHMNNLILPTISEVKRELGPDLTESFFALCPDPLKPYMGLTPLSGAGNDLWISPSDILIGKVCLKPPFTDKHMKALTHQGILKIGQDVEIKFWNEAELVKLRALAEQEEMLLYMCEMEKRRVVEEARLQERAICEQQKELMRIEFAEQLKFELEQLENKLRAEYEMLMREQKVRLDEDWQDKLEAAVAEAIARLTAQFKEDTKKLEQELHRRFKIELKKEDIKRKIDIKEMEECCEDAFMELKHQSECKNIANIMYVLCGERQKCQTEMINIEENYQKQVKELLSVITDRSNIIKAMKKEVEKSKRQLNLREECLLEILRQFQKFINFALKAVPTQGEFLLNVEKLMIFELTEAICKADEYRGKRLAKQLMRWKSDIKLPTPNLSQEVIVIKDNHDCFNEIDTPVLDRSEVGSTDYLPGFTYGEDMYVREEFRNMMSQGIKVNPSNIYLWNKDVEHLQEILLRSATSLQEQKRKEEEKIAKQKAKEEKEAQEKKLAEEKKRVRPRRSSVYFKGTDGGCGFVFPTFESKLADLPKAGSELFDEISPDEKHSSASVIIEGTCCNPCVIPKKSTRRRIPASTVESPVPLIGTRNSLELFSIKDSCKSTRPSLYTNPNVQKIDNSVIQYNERVDALLCVQDSLMKHRMSIKPVNKVYDERTSILGPEILTLSKRSRETLIEDSYTSKHGPSLLPRHEDSSILVPGCKKYAPEPEQEITLEPVESGYENLSKLSLTRNSFFLHKQSIMLKVHSDHSIIASLAEKIENGTPPCKDGTPRLTEDLDTELLKKKVHESSRLSLTRNSLELPSLHSKLSKLGKNTNTFLKRGCESSESGSLTSRQISIRSFKKVKKHSKIVLVSALKPRDYSGIKQSQVRMKAPCPKYDVEALKAPESLSLIYENEKIDEKPRPDNFLTKPNVARVIGDPYSTEYKQQNRDFTLHRANSLLTCFRKHPSLIKIFTSVTK